VITCNRCGGLSPVSAINCQNCGAPLSSNADAGLGQSRSFQDQPDLPAWLGSLRAGERPAAPADNPSNFSTADLIEEGSLPSWMRSGRPEMNDTGLSSPHLSLRPSSAPGPNTDDSKGINAQSLIDEKSLPSWMQENKPPSGPMPAGGIGAASLVQQDMMPDWMKSLQQNAPLPGPAQPMSQPAPAFPEPPAASPMATGANEFSARPAQGFSASDLVDQQSLPSWMKQQEGTGAPLPVQPGASGLSLSSLVDADSLPPWLRESATQGQKSGGLPPPSQANTPWQSAQPPLQGAGGMPQSPYGQPASSPMPQGSPVWQTASPQMPAPSGMSTGPVQGAGLAASSFIDPNALPQWLRSGNEQQNQSGGAMPPQPPASTPRGGGYNVPPRIENVRVPSRPRGEMNPNESNEAAANVFASMLGVASTTPNFPGAPPPQSQSYGTPGGSLGQGAPSSSQPYPMGNMAGQPGGANPGFTNPPMAQSQGYMSGGLYQTGNQGLGNYPAGNSYPGASQYPAGVPGVPPMSGGTGNLGMMDTGAGQKTARKPAKKGIFDVIRDWFR
jgi:hypothetical protein